MPASYFEYRYRAQFFDTDAMGVVHHSNYIRMMEMARVAWLREIEIMRLHIPHGPMVLGVTNLDVQFLKPVKFEDEVHIRVQGRLEGPKFCTQYAIWCPTFKHFAALGRVDLVLMQAQSLQPARFPIEMRSKLRELPWSDKWPEL
jgi:acyl-CoA thioester hydrolase